MKINAKISLLFSEDGLQIEIRDDDSSVTFFRGFLNRKQTCQAMSRLSSTPMVKAEVFGLDKLGRHLETDTFVFELPEGTHYTNQKDAAIETVKKLCPEGWEPDLYFGSQNSFANKGDKKVARTIIRRWVEKS